MVKSIPEKNNEAYLAYQALKSNGDLGNLAVIRSIEYFCQYLVSLSNSIYARTPKPRRIQHCIFNTAPCGSGIDDYYRANIFAAKDSLIRLKAIAQQQAISSVLKRVLIDFICDLKQFVVFFDKEQNYNWLVGSTNTHTSNFYYSLARNVFYHGKPGGNQEEQQTLSSATPFIIRQSIEYKIKRILGIDFIAISGRPHQTAAKLYFKFLRRNSAYFNTRGFDFETIELIHNWTHLFIHGGYRAAPWVTESALHYLNEFFYSGATSDVSRLTKFASVEIKASDLPALKQQIQAVVAECLGSEAQIVWLSRLEVAILKD